MFAPPSLNLDCLFDLIVKLDLFANLCKDICFLCERFRFELVSFVLCDELTVWLLFFADLPESVKQLLCWVQIVY